jgi:hypothetical protein
MRATPAFQLLSFWMVRVRREVLNTSNAKRKMHSTFNVLISHVRSIFPQEEQQMFCFAVPLRIIVVCLPADTGI